MDDLDERRTFDFRVLRDMVCPTFDFEAYRTPWDLEARRNPVLAHDAYEARKYRFRLDVPTFIAPGQIVPSVEFGVDLDVVDYPLEEPKIWVLSSDLPWSPHIRDRAIICLGASAWRKRKGHVLLGHLVIHLQHMLNWDEVGRGPRYTGFHPEATEYHRQVLGGGPITAHFPYAQLPGWLHARDRRILDDEQLFEVIDEQDPFDQSRGFEVI